MDANGTMDEDTDEKDDTKRRSRNLSEKKRRDQFNHLVNELNTMVSSTNRKMDKSTVLKSTISFLRNHNDITTRSKLFEIQENWKPTFLSNDEFSHLILEALDGFIMVFSSCGKLYYVSDSITSLLGHLPKDLLNMTIYDLTYEEDHSKLYELLLNPRAIVNPLQDDLTTENQIRFQCYMKRGGIDYQENICYELVEFIGYFRADVNVQLLTTKRTINLTNESESKLLFIGTGRIQTPQLIREMAIVEAKDNEFMSRHSFEWKFLFLDHRAPPIIGYLPFEVLGTSGYDYYHVDDLDKVVECHQSLMLKGEGISCYYRFLTKGQQWIWLQTRFYVSYHQWNSKPEFIVCTHRVVNYIDVLKQIKNNYDKDDDQHGVTTDDDRISNKNIIQNQVSSTLTMSLSSTSTTTTTIVTRTTTTKTTTETTTATATALSLIDGKLNSNKSSKHSRFNFTLSEPIVRVKYKQYSGNTSSDTTTTSMSTDSRSSRYHQYNSRSRIRHSVRKPNNHHSLSLNQHYHMNAPSHQEQQNQSYQHLPQHQQQQQQQHLSQNSQLTLQQHHHEHQQYHSNQHQEQQQQQQQHQQYYNRQENNVVSYQHQQEHGEQQQQLQQCLSLEDHQTQQHLVQQSQQQQQQQQQQQPQSSHPVMDSSQFLDPLYIPTIPIQPILTVVPTSGFTPIISPIPPPTELFHSGIVMTTTQTHIQDQLHRKHEELKLLIVQQQEELQRVSEQLFMSRYGILPPYVNTASAPQFPSNSNR